MKNTIDTTKIIVNAFITTNKKSLSIDQIDYYVSRVIEESNNRLNYMFSPFNLETLINMYNFMFIRNDNMISIISIYDKIKLRKVYRKNLSNEVLEILDEVGLELLEKEKVKIKERD